MLTKSDLNAMSSELRSGANAIKASVSQALANDFISAQAAIDSLANAKRMEAIACSLQALIGSMSKADGAALAKRLNDVIEIEFNPTIHGNGLFNH